MVCIFKIFPKIIMSFISKGFWGFGVLGFWVSTSTGTEKPARLVATKEKSRVPTKLSLRAARKSLSEARLTRVSSRPV